MVVEVEPDVRAAPALFDAVHVFPEGMLAGPDTVTLAAVVPALSTTALVGDGVTVPGLAGSNISVLLQIPRARLGL